MKVSKIFGEMPQMFTVQRTWFDNEHGETRRMTRKIRRDELELVVDLLKRATSKQGKHRLSGPFNMPGSVCFYLKAKRSGLSLHSDNVLCQGGKEIGKAPGLFRCLENLLEGQKAERVNSAREFLGMLPQV